MRGYGFVKFANAESVQEAIAKSHGTIFRGKTLIVNDSNKNKRDQNGDRRRDGNGPRRDYDNDRRPPRDYENGYRRREFNGDRGHGPRDDHRDYRRDDRPPREDRHYDRPPRDDRHPRPERPFREDRPPRDRDDKRVDRPPRGDIRRSPSRDSDDRYHKRVDHRREHSDRNFDSTRAGGYPGREDRSKYPSDRPFNKDYRSNRDYDNGTSRPPRDNPSDRDRGRDYRGGVRPHHDNSYERNHRSDRHDSKPRFDPRDDYHKKSEPYKRSDRPSRKDRDSISLSSSAEKLRKRNFNDRRANEPYGRPAEKKFYPNDRDHKPLNEGGMFEQLAKKALAGKKHDDSDDDRPNKRIKRVSSSPSPSVGK
jgi:hypothetical protein